MSAQELSAVVDGAVLLPGDDGYDEARSVWNGRFDRRPPAIVRCTSAGDVAGAVRWAAAHEQPIAVKSGGHSYAGHTVADDALLLDLSPMSGIKVKPDERRARVEAGATWAAIDVATQFYGLAVTGPTASSVGVSGSVLGGGTGWLSRPFGHTLDNLVSVDLVTAAGEQLTVSADSDPELFWGIRGAGHNLGVVTAVELVLHELGPQVLAGQIIYPFDEAERLLAEFAEFMRSAPDEFTCLPFTFRVPPIEAFPTELHGQPVLDFLVFHTDPTAEHVVAPLRQLATPILDAVAETPYAEWQQTFDPNLPAGMRYYSKAHNLPDLTPGVIADFARFVRTSQGVFTASYFEPKGGACSRVGSSETAMGDRDAGYGFHVIAGWADPAEDDSVLAWARDFGEAIGNHATCGVYLNLIGDDESGRIPTAFSDADRVAKLKSRWDPGNLLRANHNVPPA